MQETLEIKKEDALKAHDEASTKGKTLLENLFGKKIFQKDIKQRIKNFADVLEELNIDADEFTADCGGLTDDEVAYKRIKLIAQALNEGWTPDWSNYNQYKYYPWFVMGSASGVGFSFIVCAGGHSASGVGSRLCFKSRDLAEYAGKQFTEIYKEFLTLK